jgi:hypothetical protein
LKNPPDLFLREGGIFPLSQRGIKGDFRVPETRIATLIVNHAKMGEGKCGSHIMLRQICFTCALMIGSSR